MGVKIYTGLKIPQLDGTTAVSLPSTGTVVFFARDDKSVWMKRADGTEERISDS